jgi:hypothetical protein
MTPQSTLAGGPGIWRVMKSGGSPSGMSRNLQANPHAIPWDILGHVPIPDQSFIRTFR